MNVTFGNACRLAKDRKKPDRVVFDSQERAFWRVQRTAVSHLVQMCILNEVLIVFSVEV